MEWCLTQKREVMRKDKSSFFKTFSDFDMVFYQWHEKNHNVSKNTQKLKEPDWCENEFDKIVIPEECIKEFYEKNKGLVKYSLSNFKKICS
ncbi:uncharacterized protein [Parasteatoda tepidariorum]|uniref:uncharacterized protein isoform X2 n=1 Tax=Parasteatoda tepidariorum TaxID=114398 RepID=UPI0039BCE485